MNKLNGVLVSLVVFAAAIGLVLALGKDVADGGGGYAGAGILVSAGCYILLRGSEIGRNERVLAVTVLATGPIMMWIFAPS